MDASSAQDTRDSDGLRQEIPCAILRGTARGLEMVVDAHAPLDAIVAALESRLAEAPGFFHGSDVRVTVTNGPLAAGALTRLDDLAQRFELRLVEITARPSAHADSVPDAPKSATGSVPIAITVDNPGSAGVRSTPGEGVRRSINDADDEAPVAAAPEVIEAKASPEPEPEPARPAPAGVNGTRVVEGPVRSGAILDHVGHLIIFGDINPGAEVRATGNIVVLGCLRGTAHAGIGRDIGFILALQLEPQQLRIGRKVARADTDTRPSSAEIAYVNGESIVVERYSGRLPRNLSASISSI